MNYLSMFGKALLVFMIFDVLIVGLVMFQVSEGMDTPRIGFWDSQVAFIGEALTWRK